MVYHMQHLHEQNSLKSMAWVVMPDHLHWLFLLGNRKTLSGVIKQLKATSAMEVNAFYSAWAGFDSAAFTIMPYAGRKI
jgi:REP element-mobilizing transposase RayT